jgi:hypothetical protein
MAEGCWPARKIVAGVGVFGRCDLKFEMAFGGTGFSLSGLNSAWARVSAAICDLQCGRAACRQIGSLEVIALCKSTVRPNLENENLGTSQSKKKIPGTP